MQELGVEKQERYLCPVCKQEAYISKPLVNLDDNTFYTNKGSKLLTAQEAEVLYHIVDKYPIIVSREQLMYRIYWAEGEESPDDKIIDIYLHHIRIKIVGLGYKIKTVRKRGFKMVKEV